MWDKKTGKQDVGERGLFVTPECGRPKREDWKFKDQGWEHSVVGSVQEAAGSIPSTP